VGSIYIADNPDEFRIVEMCPPAELIVEDIRLTVDEDEDYLMLSKLYDHLWPENSWVDLKNAIQWLKEREDVSSLNKHIRHKELNIEVQEKRKKWRDIVKVGVVEYDSTL
jgi:spore coat polysaccharide biosynthesis protein SpsF (cytidylyltransferase family)